jgi:hypothetical protein
MGLQRFKLHLANSVITQENSSLQSMDTTQLLDLMKYSGTTAGEAALGGGDGEAAVGLDGTVPEPSKGGKGGGEKSALKSVLENLRSSIDLGRGRVPRGVRSRCVPLHAQRHIASPRGVRGSDSNEGGEDCFEQEFDRAAGTCQSR